MKSLNFYFRKSCEKAVVIQIVNFFLRIKNYICAIKLNQLILSTTNRPEGILVLRIIVLEKITVSSEEDKKRKKIMFDV